jgi:hypothetical protein
MQTIFNFNWLKRHLILLIVLLGLLQRETLIFYIDHQLNIEIEAKV